MKKFISAALLFWSFSSSAQLTATNFNCNDCNGTNHDLFTELDAGKVIVLVWIMPCGTCIGPALEAQTRVQGAEASHPGKVKLYIADDYVNTSCQSLKYWCEENNITVATLFSDASITMSDYGKNGMPKVVVLGGTDHKVFYNENDADITEQAIGDAIAAAIAASPGTVTGVARENEVFTARMLYPNPVQNTAEIEIFLAAAAKLTVEVMDGQGRLVRQAFARDLRKGKQKLTIDMIDLAAGTYFLRISEKTTSRAYKIILSH